MNISSLSEWDFLSIQFLQSILSLFGRVRILKADWQLGSSCPAFVLILTHALMCVRMKSVSCRVAYYWYSSISKEAVSPFACARPGRLLLTTWNTVAIVSSLFGL